MGVEVDAKQRTTGRPKGVALLLSQSFLPGGGGLERFVNFVAAELEAQSIARTEVICLSKGDQKNEADFDAKYPRRVFRGKNRLYLKARGLNQHFNSVVGGNQQLNVLGKASMFLYVAVTMCSMAGLVVKRAWAHRKSNIVLHCMSLSSLALAVSIKRLLFFCDIEILFSNQFTYKKPGFLPGDLLMTMLMRHAKRIVCVSHYAAEQLCRSFRIDKRRVAVCYSWQPLPDIDAGTFAEMTKRKTGRIKLLFVGRIVPEKGIQKIINLARYIDAHGLGAKYAITVIGDSTHPIKDKLAKAAQKYQSLRYIGRVENHLLWKHYAAHDIFLLPVEWEEAFGRVVIEAYSMGMPVVATNIGAMQEMLGIFPQSFLVEKDHSTQSLLEAVDHLYAATKKVANEAFLTECRKIVARTFSVKNFITYQIVYNELLHS